MKIAVDLLWVKHSKVGGIETYVLNLLDGISVVDKENSYILIVSKDNRNVFDKYTKSPIFTLHECNVTSVKVLRTVIWENLFLDKLVTKIKPDLCFVPYYRKPILKTRNKYLIVLHDLQALHYPEYFSKLKYIWLMYYWKFTLNSAYHVIAISKYVKDDIVKRYRIPQKRISVIYNPISISPERNIVDTLRKYNLRQNGYYYTISSLLKHKNVITILKAIKELKENGDNPKLVITGIKGSSTNDISQFIVKNGLESSCIYTDYISDDEKFDLLRGCKLFLFPSIFEGFGMPPIESLLVGTNVITTKCTSIPEVTDDKAIYVDNPFDEREWADKMRREYPPVSKNIIEELSSKYNSKNIVKKYISLFNKLFNDK